MDHLAIPVRDQARSRRFYETYLGFGARPAKRHDDGVLMLYNATGFALALGPSTRPIARPSWMHFGMGLPSRAAVLAMRDRFVSDGIELVGGMGRARLRQRQVPRSGRLHHRGFVGARVSRHIARLRVGACGRG